MVDKRQLYAQTLDVASVDVAVFPKLFEPFARHYDGADADTFASDLAKKTHIIILRNQHQDICGFSTLCVDEHVTNDQTYRIFFSGDTIVEPEYWGTPVLQTAWLRLVGQLLRDEALPAYWLLTSKGHRTYRLLPLWFKTWFPSHRNDHVLSSLAGLAHSLGRSRYGQAYDPETSVIYKNGAGDRLNTRLAHVPPKDARRKDVRFFLEQNTGFAKGDELLCLAELKLDNLTRFSRRAFANGMEYQL